MAGSHTLAETERQVSSLLRGMNIDFKAMTVVSNLFRAANAARNHLEREVLSGNRLSWTGFVVLWVVWVWGECETREIAEEVGTSKATLTGVLKTLERDKLVAKRRSKSDGRLVLVTLTGDGKRLMTRIFPEFNKQEVYLVSSLEGSERKGTADALRKITLHARGDLAQKGKKRKR
ncbi:MAG: MarR family transcriptional regulator [Actinobacteria bacterium]|nr:MarR family transcriptional regulator [Actinomycetota bacterium]